MGSGLTSRSFHCKGGTHERAAINLDIHGHGAGLGVVRAGRAFLSSPRAKWENPGATDGSCSGKKTSIAEGCDGQMEPTARLIHTFGKNELFEISKGAYLLVERIGATTHKTKLTKKEASRWIQSHNYRTTII